MSKEESGLPTHLLYTRSVPSCHSQTVQTQPTPKPLNHELFVLSLISLDAHPCALMLYENTNGELLCSNEATLLEYKVSAVRFLCKAAPGSNWKSQILNLTTALTLPMVLILEPHHPHL